MTDLKNFFGCKVPVDTDPRIRPSLALVVRDQNKQYYFKIHAENHDRTKGVAYEAGVYQYIREQVKGTDYSTYNFLRLVDVLHEVPLDPLISIIGNSALYETKFCADEKKTPCHAHCHLAYGPNDKKKNNQNIVAFVEKLYETVDDPSFHIWLYDKTKKMIDYTYTVVITEAIENPISLSDFFKSTKTTLATKLGILSRLILLIRKVHEMKVSHNDLHWHNVLVRHHTAANIEYKIDDSHKITYRDVEYSPVVLDWDRAQINIPDQYGDNEDITTGEHYTYNDQKLYDPPFFPARDYCKFISSWLLDSFDEMSPHFLDSYQKQFAEPAITILKAYDKLCIYQGKTPGNLKKFWFRQYPGKPPPLEESIVDQLYYLFRPDTIRDFSNEINHELFVRAVCDVLKSYDIARS